MYNIAICIIYDVKWGVSINHKLQFLWENVYTLNIIVAN